MLPVSVGVASWCFMSDPTAPSPQTDSPAPIRLEMSRKTKISCTVILLVAVALFVGSSRIVQGRGRAKAEEFASNVYVLVSQVPPQYQDIHYLLSSSAEQTLQ